MTFAEAGALTFSEIDLVYRRAVAFHEKAEDAIERETRRRRR
jgi:hypothetical protein